MTTSSSSSSSIKAPPLSNETILCRLETGAHGSRASLTKCATRYRDFLESIHAEQANAEAIEESKQLFETELSLYKVEFTKLALRVQMYQQELEQLDEQSQCLVEQIAEKKRTLADLREAVQRSKKVWGYKEEYEALAKMANHRPSRAILEKRRKLSQKQMELPTQNLEALQQELSIRQAQFQALMQCMLDLKASVQQDSHEGGEEEEEEGEEVEEDGIVPMDTTL